MNMVPPSSTPPSIQPFGMGSGDNNTVQQLLIDFKILVTITVIGSQYWWNNSSVKNTMNSIHKKADQIEQELQNGTITTSQATNAFNSLAAQLSSSSESYFGGSTIPPIDTSNPTDNLFNLLSSYVAITEYCGQGTGSNGQPLLTTTQENNLTTIANVIESLQNQYDNGTLTSTQALKDLNKQALAPLETNTVLPSSWHIGGIPSNFWIYFS